MDRHGSLIWWLVCIGLVLCWVWNFQTAVETSSKDISALEMNPIRNDAPPEMHQPLRMPYPDENIKRADEIVKQMAETQASASPFERTELQQASTFGTRKSKPDTEGNEMPFIDLRQDSSELFANTEKKTNESAPARNDIRGEAREMVSSNLQSTDRWQRNEYSPQRDKQRISNPYFNNAPEQPLESVQAADPVLTQESTRAPEADYSQPSELSSLPKIAVQEKQSTDFADFNDLKQERTQWQQENTIQVSPADQFVNSNETTPIVPAGKKLTSNATTIQQCVNHIEYGKSLARRGAAFAAREEFYSALRLIAQSNDAQTRSTAYTAALREAITALNEADDFYAEISHEGMDVNVAHVVDAHQSKIIPMDRAEGMSSMIAIQAYFEFARQRMGDSFGENVIASEALYSLGKLFTVAAAHDLTGNPLDYSKSIVMHYAAIDCDSNNFKSSNELGVLMARNGRLEKARDLFRDSLLVERLPQTWRNLAVVHERIANASSDSQVVAENRDLAQKAGLEYEITRQSNQSMSPKVQWVTPEQFEQTAPPEFNEPRTAQAQPDPVQTQPAKPGMFSRWKDMF